MAGVLKIKKSRSPWQSNTFATAKFTVGAKSANAINAAVQLQDDNGGAITVRGGLLAYLSDASTGAGISGTAPDTSVAIGTNGNIVVTEVTKLAWTIGSDGSGRFDLTITHTGSHTYYLVLVMPDGSLVVSPAIVF